MSDPYIFLSFSLHVHICSPAARTVPVTPMFITSAAQRVEELNTLLDCLEHLRQTAHHTTFNQKIERSVHTLQAPAGTCSGMWIMIATSIALQDFCSSSGCLSATVNMSVFHVNWRIPTSKYGNCLQVAEEGVQ